MGFGKREWHIGILGCSLGVMGLGYGIIDIVDLICLDSKYMLQFFMSWVSW